MTATETKFRRGTEAQCEAMVPVEAEVIVDLSNDRLRLGDGLEPGGIIIPNARDIQTGKFSTGVALGTNNLLITFDPPYQAYATDMEINWKQPANNTGPMTVEIDALGSPKALEKMSGGGIVALAADDVVGGGYYSARFNGTKLLLMSSVGGGVNSLAANNGIVTSAATGALTIGLNTNNPGGVGTTVAAVNGGPAVANGGTTSGAYLGLPETGTGVNGVGAVSIFLGYGTWRNVTGVTIPGPRDNYRGAQYTLGTWIRVA